MQRKLLSIIVPLLLALELAPTLAAEHDNLPTLGDASSGIISLKKERELGQQFLRAVRGSTRTLHDPLLLTYVEHLVYRLASHSQLQDRRLDLIILNSPALNAFAAPGGIIGINHGLFFHARTEQEFSAILAHEIAHLSQRHYARQIQAGKKTTAVNLAGLLAGVILGATVGTDAGLAAIAGSQALSQSEVLEHSREREAEADRIGIHTLAEAGMDPRAMAYMFERLQTASRYSAGNRIPEFLRTHPVTRSRIADAYNQTRNHPREEHPLQLGYQTMQARARAITGESAEMRKYFESRLDDEEPARRVAAKYGLALTLVREGELEGARQHVGELREAHPYNIAFRIAEASIHSAGGQYDDALALLGEALALNPRNYALSVSQAVTYVAAGRPHAALDVLVPISIERPSDEHIWYLLAEAYGLTQNIPRVHEARAEFFVLNGNYDKAIEHLGYALPLVRDNFQQTERIRQRLDEVWEMKGP